MLDPQTYLEIVLAYYREAKLLDTGRFHEWLDFFSDDLLYTVRTPEYLQGVQDDPELPHFDWIRDSKEDLAARVKKLDTGLAHVETPASITQHAVTNILPEEGVDGDMLVSSDIIVTQVRRDVYESIWSGRREDVLRMSDEGWKIVKRDVLLVQKTLPRALSIFL